MPGSSRAVSGIPYTMVGLDVTEPARCTRTDLDPLGSDTPVTRLARAMLDPYVDVYEPRHDLTGFALHDPLAAAVATDPGSVRFAHGRGAVETTSDLTLGETVFFPDGHRWQPQGVAAASSPGQVALELARPGFAHHLTQRLAAHPLPAAT